MNYVNRLLISLLALICAVGTRASIITFQVKDVTGANFDATATFTRLDMPFTQGGSGFPRPSAIVKSVNGVITTPDLVQGKYVVSITGYNFNIIIPNAPGVTYTLSSLPPVYISIYSTEQELWEVKVSPTDTLHKLLIDKLVKPDGSSLTITNAPDGSEQIIIEATGGGGTGTGEANTASNLGASGVGVFNSKSGVDLRLSKIDTTGGATVSSNANRVLISAAAAVHNHDGSEITTGAVADARIASTITRNTDWNTIAKMEGITGANILTGVELDTSGELASLLSDETGSGSAVFATNPLLTDPTLTSLTLNTFFRSGITNISTGSASYTFGGPGANFWTNGANTTITLTLVPTSTSQGQRVAFSAKGNGTATIDIACATHTIVWRTPQIRIPANGQWIDYDLFQFGTLIFAYAYADGAMVTPPQITSDQNDYNPTGLPTAVSMRLSSDDQRSITGLAGQTDGRQLVVHNIGTTNIILTTESTSSIATNRFALNASATLLPNQSALLQYDLTSARWRAVFGVGTGSGGGGGSTNSITVDSATVSGTPNLKSNALRHWLVTSSDITDEPSGTTLAYSGTNVTVNADLGTSFELTATNNFNLLITGGKKWQAITIHIKQDSTGSRLIAQPPNLATNWVFGDEITGILLTTTAGREDSIRAECRGSSAWKVLGVAHDYAAP